MNTIRGQSIKRGVAVGGSVLLVLIALVTSAAAPQTAITSITVGGANDISFKVWWVTDTITDGRVHWGATPALGNIAEDVRGAATQADVHFVTVSGLNPQTTYYFDVESGGVINNNGGAHYTVTTAPTLGIPSPESVYGRVLLDDGTTAKVGAALRMILQDADGQGSPGTSAPLLALSASDGWWWVDLGGARTANLSASFSHSLSGDRLAVLAEGGADGQGHLVTGPGITVPLANLALQTCPWDFDHDGDVDIIDVQRVAYRWGSHCGDGLYDPQYDTDADCDIDILDVQRVAYRWGSMCTTEAFSIAPTAALPSSPAKLDLEVPYAALAPGEVYTAALTIQNAVDLGAFEVNLVYDPAVVEPLSTVLGPFPASSGRTFMTTDASTRPDTGSIAVGAFSLGASPQGSNGSGTLALLRFRALSKDMPHIRITDATVANVAGASVPLVTPGITSSTKSERD